VSTGVGPSSYRNSGYDRCRIQTPHSMTRLIVLPEQIMAEVASEVAPDGMDVIGVVLCIVHLDQE